MRETLERVAGALGETGARRVYALGDNFHDEGGAARLEAHAAGMLAALTRVADWLWITGNHDPALDPALGGTVTAEAEIAGLVLRHEARPGETRPELSGHFHPKLRVRLRGRHIARPCAVRAALADGAERMILPAFGAYTGGMDAADPAIRAALAPARQIDAVVVAGERLATFPLWRAAA